MNIALGTMCLCVGLFSILTSFVAHSPVSGVNLGLGLINLVLAVFWFTR